MAILDNDDFAILAGPWGGDSRPSLFYIKKRNTGTHSTEVHVLSAASGHKDFSLHTGTDLHETNREYVFKLADWDGDGIPDLWVIKTGHTATSTTEVHIFSGASNFEHAILHTGTALHETDDTFAFDVLQRGSARPDLVAIKRSDTGTKTTELHILDGSSNFQAFSLHTGTGLHETGRGDDWSFVMTDWNRDGIPDLVIVSPAHGCELHALQGPAYQAFNLHSPVPEDGNLKGLLDIPDDQWAMIRSCGLAATGMVLNVVAPFTLFGEIALFVTALDCYRNIGKFTRQAAGSSGGRGDRSGPLEDRRQPSPTPGPTPEPPPHEPPPHEPPPHEPPPHEPPPHEPPPHEPPTIGPHGPLP